MERIGVRELRQNASKYLARVQAGERFEVTDRGRLIAELGPPRASAWDRLVAEGLLVPGIRSGEPLGLEPVALPPGSSSASETLQALREDRR